MIKPEFKKKLPKREINKQPDNGDVSSILEDTIRNLKMEMPQRRAKQDPITYLS